MRDASGINRTQADLTCPRQIRSRGNRKSPACDRTLCREANVAGPKLLGNISPDSAPPSADHAIDLPAAALSAPEPPGPFEQGQPRAVALDLFGNVGLDLVPALLASDD